MPRILQRDFTNIKTTFEPTCNSNIIYMLIDRHSLYLHLLARQVQTHTLSLYVQGDSFYSLNYYNEFPFIDNDIVFFMKIVVCANILKVISREQEATHLFFAPSTFHFFKVFHYVAHVKSGRIIVQVIGLQGGFFKNQK